MAFRRKLHSPGQNGASRWNRAVSKSKSSAATDVTGEYESENGEPHEFPKSPFLSVIIPVWNERSTIAAVIREAKRVHKETEIIVVANGTTDGSDRIAARLGARVVSFPKPLGHDVGRGIGAANARGQVLLFLDGDIVIPARELVPYVRAVERGVDVALNKYSGPVRRGSVHAVVLAKYALNMILQRPDMHGTSLTTIPHAISRRALTVIGTEKLQVPPLAQAVALEEGLIVEPVHFVSVGKPNPRRRREYRVDPVETLIVGDHLEAICWLAALLGERGGLEDTIRLRDWEGEHQDEISV